MSTALRLSAAIIAAFLPLSASAAPSPSPLSYRYRYTVAPIEALGAPAYFQAEQIADHGDLTGEVAPLDLAEHRGLRANRITAAHWFRSSRKLTFAANDFPYTADHRGDQLVIQQVGQRYFLFDGNAKRPIPGSGAGDVVLTGLSDQGDAAGELDRSLNNSTGLLIEKGRRTVNLGRALGEPEFAAYCINDRREIVGVAGLLNKKPAEPAVEERFVVWNRGRWSAIPGLRYHLTQEGVGNTTNRVEINNSGTVLISLATLPSLTQRTYLWSGGEPRELPGDNTEGVAINDQGVVVGLRVTSSARHTSCAFVSSKGKVADLNALAAPKPGRHLDEALSINNRGQILCEQYGENSSGGTYFVLTPK